MQLCGQASALVALLGDKPGAGQHAGGWLLAVCVVMLAWVAARDCLLMQFALDFRDAWALTGVVAVILAAVFLGLPDRGLSWTWSVALKRCRSLTVTDGDAC